MANERLYLRCCACGSMLMLGKCYPTTGWFRCPARGEDDDGGVLGTWLDKHEPAWNHEGEYDRQFVGKDGMAVRFEIVHETDDDFREKYDQHLKGKG